MIPIPENRIKKSVDFREMVARKCFEKSGMIPDVEFMDSYAVRKAADEADFNEMADAVSNQNRLKEIAETKKRNDRIHGPSSKILDPYRIENADLYARLKRGKQPTEADLLAQERYRYKETKPDRRETSRAINLTIPQVGRGQTNGYNAAQDAKDIVAYNTGSWTGSRMVNSTRNFENVKEGVKSAIVKLLTENYEMDAKSAQRAAVDFINGIHFGYLGGIRVREESEEEYNERMQNMLMRLKSEKKI